jgi:hypothetical protein
MTDLKSLEKKKEGEKVNAYMLREEQFPHESNLSYSSLFSATKSCLTDLAKWEVK